MDATRDPEARATASTDGLTEEEFRRVVRSRYSDTEIDLILELVWRVPVAIWAASGEAFDFAVRLWSPGAEQLYGFKKSDIIDKNYITQFVNRLEQRRAMEDHSALETTGKPYRNLARDLRVDKTPRLMLTQGIALWHPALGHYLQGEIAVDATDVPGKDRTWLEQVLTPESVRSLLAHFTAMTRAASVSLEKVTEAAGTLIKVFLGESAECQVFVERVGSQLSLVGHGALISACSFDPKAVVRWCMKTKEPTFLVDYVDHFPPSRTTGRRSLPFPDRLRNPSAKAPFAVCVVRDEENRPRGGVFVCLAPGVTFSELTDVLLSAVSGTVTLALAIEEKISQTKREGSLSAKEREGKATVRLARQYRHAVLKKAHLLGIHSDLLSELPSPDTVARIAAALSSMSRNLIATGRSFEMELKEEEFNLGNVLSSVTGAVIQDYPSVRVARDTLPEVWMRGVRPFIEGALESILVNAVEAQKYQGEIGVSCDAVVRSGRSHSFLDVYVCDNGPGLPVEIREKIREGQQISTKGPERGLGLVIARQSLEECGGEIFPLSDPLPPWRGACFRVRLPVLDRRPRKA